MQRLEFVQFARQPQANIRELCRRFTISPATAYKWLERFERDGLCGLSDRSRRPHHSPAQCSTKTEQLVLQLHRRFPYWGPRKLRQLLPDHLTSTERPAVSTLARILKRHGCRVLCDTSPQPPYQRFSYPAPNQLWQMDFKGDFPLARSGRCFPLTLLDDHSRFALLLRACPAVNRAHVQPALQKAFHRYGLPEKILCDNAGPWGTSDPHVRFTALGVWLLRLGVEITHGRPYHPQTQGKCERFHRTLKVELLNRSIPWRSLPHCQQEFDQWRHRYNHLRPHHALQMTPPATHYQPATRPMPKCLPPIEYLPGDFIRLVKAKGEITFQNHFFTIGQAFARLPVALRPMAQDGLFALFFSWKQLGFIDLTAILKNKFRYNPLILSS
jgi:transposase InsO family protein